MKKNIIIALILIASVFLVSCKAQNESEMPHFGRLHYYDDEKSQAEEILKGIVEAINDKDKDALKDMYSKTALEKAENLDEGIDYCFDLIDGKIESWEFSSGNTSGSTGADSYTKIMYEYRVYTKETSYYIIFKYYTKYEDNPDCLGLYSLKIYKYGESEPSFRRAGAYKPEE